MNGNGFTTWLTSSGIKCDHEPAGQNMILPSVRVVVTSADNEGHHEGDRRVCQDGRRGEDSRER